KVKYFVQCLLGQSKVPTREQMLNDIKAEREQRAQLGISERYTHYMVKKALFWEYELKLCDLGNIPRISDVNREIFNRLPNIREKYPTFYKKLHIQVDSSSNQVTFTAPQAIASEFGINLTDLNQLGVK